MDLRRLPGIRILLPPRRLALVVWLAVVPGALTACASRAGAPPGPAAPARGPVSMAGARAALAAGQLADATVLFERLAVEAPKRGDRVEAMERAAFLRAGDHAGLRDLARARHWIALRRTQGGPPARLAELNALDAVVLDLERLEGEAFAWRAAHGDGRGGEEGAGGAVVPEAGGAAAAAVTAAGASRDRERERDLRALKASNASLQAEVSRLREALQEKEDALRKIAASLAGNDRKP